MNNFKKIVTSLNELNTFSKKIIIHGCQFAVLLLVITGILFVFFKGNYDITLISRYMVETSASLFTEFILFALIIDYIFKTKEKN